MNNARQSKKRPTGDWKKLDTVIRVALSEPDDVAKALVRLRPNYLAQKRWACFPRSVFMVAPRTAGASDAQKNKFWFKDSAAGRRFVRNLWFLDQFMPRPPDVVKFLAGSEKKREEMALRRLTELTALARSYDHWSKTAEAIKKAAVAFDPVKSDFLAASRANTGEPTVAVSSDPGNAAIADLIREIEQRASYQAGNPEDACEKALYFLALGRPDVAQVIATDVLRENPDNGVALYANAVLLLNQSGRHRHQAFVIDNLYPQDLTPVDAEEHYHAQLHGEEMGKAWEKADQAFVLLLKARQHWPKKFSPKRSELSPAWWQYQIEDRILREAISRLDPASDGLRLYHAADTASATAALKWLLSEVWRARRVRFFAPDSADQILDFLLVAHRLDTTLARQCLDGIEQALVAPSPKAHSREWEVSTCVTANLPVDTEPSLAEKLLGGISRSSIYTACFALAGAERAFALVKRIRIQAEAERHDRATARRTIAALDVVRLHQREGKSSAIALCRLMAEQEDWPATELGRRLRNAWRYTLVLAQFEASRDAFENGDVPAATQLVCDAVSVAVKWFDEIADDGPLFRLTEWDEFAGPESMGDLLMQRPNVVSASVVAEWFGSEIPWLRPRKAPSWTPFLEWCKVGSDETSPVLLAYGRWLGHLSTTKTPLAETCEELALKLRKFRAS